MLNENDSIERKKLALLHEKEKIANRLLQKHRRGFPLDEKEIALVRAVGGLLISKAVRYADTMLKLNRGMKNERAKDAFEN